jgi:hypothetical protein
MRKLKLEAETTVILICILAIIVLSVYVAASYHYFSTMENKAYSVAFGNNETFNFYRDGDLTAILSNNENNSQSLSLYGFGTTTPPQSRIFASLFSDMDNDIIDFGDIVFDGQRVLPLQVHPDRPTISQVSVRNLDLGLYHGWFYITGQKNYSIPITISTVPMLGQSILIILIGSISAIAILELQKYAKRKNMPKKKQELYEEIEDINAYTDAYISGVAGPINPNEEALLWSATTQRESKMQAVALAESKEKDLKNRYSGLAAKLRQAALSLAPMLFAAIVGVIAFLNNIYVTSIVELNFQDVIILFGLGAGISSIKALLDRS